MGVYRTAIVQGLSIAHGRGERRQFCPGIPELISITLKDSGRGGGGEKVSRLECTRHGVPIGRERIGKELVTVPHQSTPTQVAYGGRARVAAAIFVTVTVTPTQREGA